MKEGGREREREKKTSEALFVIYSTLIMISGKRDRRQQRQ